ncbi:MAG TPA: hydantoinase B/oxoprolinase family protein [Bryobacteraceae bacterium]|nr:hydantoinase B/oxoprolinase family protein [Bryobacteraceae bacterium]
MKISATNFNIIGHGLHAVAQEMGEKLVRSAYSTIIREARDCSTSLLDCEGHVIAQAQFCPIHMNSFGKVFEAFAQRYDLSRIQPGEALLTNDPYSGGQHLNDFVLFTPIFVAGDLTAYSASIGHHIDIGGGAAGPNTRATEVIQEGLRIPLLKFDLERDLGAGMLEQFIRLNVRPPDLVMGDVYAQVAANRTGENRFLELVERFGKEAVLETAVELQNYSERLTRALIRELPNGVYEGEDFVDDNGFDEEPLRVAVRVTIHDDSMHVDLSGSAPQTKGIINSPLTSTISAVYQSIGFLLNGAVPVNDGVYRPISIDVPYGSFLNPSLPVAVRARNNPCHRITNAVMRALAKVAPERVVTSGHDTTNAIGMGHMGKDGSRVYMEVVGGGWGATQSSDGVDVVDSYVGNCSNIPVESLEQDYPFMMVEEYGIRRGSAGAGKFRGGMGARRVYRILEDDVMFNAYSDRFRILPWGLFGGKPGAPSQFTVERGGVTIHLGSKVNFPLRRGDRLIIEIAGGGGYGDPRERSREAVLRDIEYGFLNMEQAREQFGFDPTREPAEVSV